MTLKSIIEKLGFDPFDPEQNVVNEPDGVLDDTGSPYDVLTNEEMHFLVQEAYQRYSQKE